MSDGGGESGRELEQSNRTVRKSSGGGDDFAQAILKIAVAQVCEIVGYQTFQLSALETLSDVAVQYIHNIGKTAHLYANLSGRTDCNVFDIIQGLEDLSGAQGFAGASDVNHCLASSGTVKDISQYVAEAEHIPFAYSVPRFPVIKDRKLTLSFWQSGEEAPGEHIPTWLPAFPEPQTYAQPATCNERATEPDSATDEHEKQQRNVEQAMLNFQRRLVCNGMEGPSVDPGDAEKEKQTRENNPFLAAPLQFGETEVSQVTLPAKLSTKPTEETLKAQNHDKCSSVLETFAPAIEAIKNKSFEVEEDQKTLSSNKPTVQFKIGMSKKSLGSTLYTGPHKKGFEEVYPWFGRENEKDEKKRRAEKILKNSMENSQELAQL